MSDVADQLHVDDMESSEDEASLLPTLDADVPEFEAIPRWLWVNQSVSIHNDLGVQIAEGLLRNSSSALVIGASAPLGDTHVAVQISKTFPAAQASGDWRYSVRAFPITHVFCRGVALHHHCQRDTYNTVIAMRERRLGPSTRPYITSSRITPTLVSSKITTLLTQQSVNAVASNVCCPRNCVQLYPRDKVKSLRQRAYFGTSYKFRNHFKLDVHRQFHLDNVGRKVVTLEGIDVCAKAWMHIMGVGETTFYRYKKEAMAGVSAQNHGNMGQQKPRNHTIVATAALRVLLNRNVDLMPHKSRVLPSGEKSVAKVLPANFKWKDQIPAIDDHLSECGLKPLSTSNLSKIRRISFSEYNAKKPGDNFARCSSCDKYHSQRKLHQPGTGGAILWQRRLDGHLSSAWAHRDLYYSNRYRSQNFPDECVTIMHDKMDHAKTASPVFSHKTKHLDSLMRLPIAVTGILAHGHGDVRYAHYGLDLYSHDVNYTVGSFAKVLRDLELPPKSSSRELFVGSGTSPLYKAILQGADMCLSSLPLAPTELVRGKPLPPILHVQMDNAASDNKNRFVFCFWSLLVAKRIFREVYVNFMLVGHTHDDIDALFGRWSMALKKESFPTIPLLMKSFMDIEVVPTIPHLVEEVPDFKEFIKNSIASGEESLLGHSKAHQFKFYVDGSGCPVMKYKIHCHDDDWLPKEGDAIKLWKEDSEGNSLWPRGEPKALKPQSMRQLSEVRKGISGFVDYWERLSNEDPTGEFRRRYEHLCYYWRAVEEALGIPFESSTTLQDGFWPSSRIEHTIEDQFTEFGDVREDYDEDNHFVGQRRHRPPQSFRVVRDVFAGYFLAIRPCDGDERPVWIARALSDPNANPERPNCVLIQYFRPTSRSANVQRFYTGWDSLNGLSWRVDADQVEEWENTASIMTSWKAKVSKSTSECTIKIPSDQVQIIKASLTRIAAPEI